MRELVMHVLLKKEIVELGLTRFAQTNAMRVVEVVVGAEDAAGDVAALMTTEGVAGVTVDGVAVEAG